MQHRYPLHHSSFPASLPVLGHLFRTYHLRKTAFHAVKGDPAAARSLARQYCQCPDGTTESLLRSVIESNKFPIITDALCQEVLEHHDTLLCTLLRDYDIVPSDTEHRVLFFFATGSLPEYLVLDAMPGHPILRKMYFGAPESIRALVRNAAIRYHTEAVFTDALSCISANDLSYEEWEIVVAGLISGSRQTVLYRLLLDAPVPYAAYAIRVLHDADWAPVNASLRELWEQAVKTAPRRWTYPDVSGEKRRVLESPGSRTRFITFSPDGSLLAATGYDGTLRIWDVPRGSLVSSCHPGSGSSRPVFSPDSKCLLTLSRGILTSRRVSNGEILFKLPGGCREYCTIAVSQDGHLVAFPRAGSGLILAGLAEGNIVRTADTGDPEITALAFSPDGKKIACGKQDGTVQLVLVENGNVVWESERYSRRIECLSFPDNGSGILAVPEKGSPVLLDETTGSCSRIFAAPAHRLRAGSISPDGRWIFLTGADDAIQVFRTGGAAPAGNIPARKGGVASAAFAPVQRLAVTGSISGIVRIFRFDSDAPENMFTAHDGGIHALAISPDESLFASAGWDGRVKLWSLPEGRPVRSLDARGGAVTCLAAAGDGSLLAAGTSEGLIRLWRLPNEDYLTTMDVFTGSVGAIAVNGNGTLIATAGSDVTVRIWEVRSGSLVSTLAGLKSRSYCLAFTPDSTGVLAGGWDNTVRLFRVSDGSLLRSFPGHSNIITGIAVREDGSGFVSSSYDGTCQIHDLAGGNAPRRCVWDGARVDAMAVSQDGTFIAAADRDGRIRIFSDNGTHRFTLTGTPSRVTGLALVQGNDLLVASSDDGSIAYFSLRQQSHVRNFSAHAGKVRGLTVTGGGKQIASAGDDGIIQLMQLPLCVPLSSLLPDYVPVAIREAHGHSNRPEREQWVFLATLLALKNAHEICLCSPPPALDEFEIMVVG